MNEWLFTPLEFAVAWSGFDRDVPPWPIEHVPTAETQEDYLREVDAASERIAGRMSPDLYHALATLAAPDVRVEVTGRVGPHHALKVRIHAAVRGPRATLVVQATDDRVYLDAFPATRLPDRIVGAMPRMRPGGCPPLHARVDELWASGPSTATSAGLLRRLLTQPRTGFGYISAHPGATLDNRRDERSRGLHYLDCAEDGRYLAERDHATLAVRPVDAASLATAVHQLAAAVTSGTTSM
jgi:hypothetical protein